jgi:hypothetical protein
LSAGLTAGAGAFLAWLAAGHPGRSVIHWLTSYRGDASTAQQTVAYGLHPTAGGLLEAGIRSSFGLASALVDLSPLSGYLRQGFALGLATIVHPIVALLALTLALLGLRRLLAGSPSARIVGCTAVAVVAALWLFGMLWDNSDDQFFFQVTPWWAAAVIAAVEGRSRAVLAIASLVLLTNARDLAANYILPDRAAKVTLLQHALRPGLVVAAGGDDVSAMLAAHGLGSDDMRLLKIRSVADSLPASQGLEVIRDAIQAALARGETVTTVNVLGMDARRFPWPGLRRRGYELGEVEKAFAGAVPEVTVRQDWVTIAEVRRRETP